MTKEVISDQLMYQIKKYEAQGHSRLETVQEFHLDYKAIRLLELKTRIDELKKTKWNDYAFPERARVLINEGFPKQQISRELGINLSTICYWEKNNFKLRGKKRSEGGSNKLPFGDKYFHFLNCLSKINAGETISEDEIYTNDCFRVLKLIYKIKRKPKEINRVLQIKDSAILLRSLVKEDFVEKYEKNSKLHSLYYATEKGKYAIDAIKNCKWKLVEDEDGLELRLVKNE